MALYDQLHGIINKKEKTSQEILKACVSLNNELNAYEYGWIVNNKLSDNFDTIGRDYRTSTPEDFKKYKGGVCWDYMLYQKVKLSAENIINRNFYIEFSDKTSTTHTFTVVPYEKKFLYIESSYKNLAGVWEFDSLEYIFSFLISSLISGFKLPDKFILFEIPDSFNETGLSTLEFMNYMVHNGKRINYKLKKGKPGKLLN